MNIALLDVDGHNYPNLALMKLAAWHRANGDYVELYDPMFSHPDRLYASKVFTFTEDYAYYPTDCDVVKGGTGYDATVRLPDEVERMLPDYGIYPQYDFAIGFLTRGCVNKCPWCIVPRKEGGIRVVDDIERIAVRKEVRLMDNNFLAADGEFVKEQLEKMRRGKWRIDFNQALDCRRVTEENARLLAKVSWAKYIRFSCDQPAQIEPLRRAIALLRESGYKGAVFVYVLSRSVDDGMPRVEAVDKMGGVPYVMPYRDFTSKSAPSPELVKFRWWCNSQAVRKRVKWEDAVRNYKKYMPSWSDTTERML